MSGFDAVIAASLSGNNPAFVLLFDVEFASGTNRLWTGRGSRRFGGQVYDGSGILLGIEGLQAAINGAAPETIFSLAATDELARIALLEFKAEARGRRVYVSLQFLQPGSEQALGEPWRIWSGLILSVSYQAAPQGDLRLSVKAEALTSLRSRPRNIMLSDAEQKRRYPGDRGLEFVTSVRRKEILWPEF